MEILDFEVITDKRVRLEEVRLALNINKSELARRLDSPQAHINKVLALKATLGDLLADKIVRRLRLNPDWWETGEGEMFLDYELEDARPLVGEEQLTYRPTLVSRANMWVVPVRKQAAFLRGFASRSFDELEHTYFPMITVECFCFEVEGFAMFPQYPAGAYLVCTLLENRDWFMRGRPHYFQTDDQLILANYVGTDGEAVQLSATNPDYNPLPVLPLSEIRQAYTIEFVIDKNSNRAR